MSSGICSRAGTVRVMAFSFGLAIVLALGGCGAVVTGRAWMNSEEVKPSSDKVVVIGEVRSAPAIESANKFALMALFAKIAYRNDLPPERRAKESCAYLLSDAMVPDVGMPRKADGTGWKRWKGTPEAVACINEGGLSYETYVHELKDGTMDEAVIAFRGTENSTLNESLEDWASNVAAAIGIEPPQFITAQRLIPGLIDGLVLQSPRIRIFATGHSLGGGLAQQAGYISEHILEVYTFDTSPVTNWSFLMLHKAVRQTDPKIFRVYHWHEGLAYVRNISSRFETRRFGRSDYEFYFQQVSPIAAHEMGILACHLSKIVQGPEADHYYPREYAEAVISPSYRLPEHYAHPVCPPTVSLREP